MAANPQMEQLVQLFLQAALAENADKGGDGKALTPEAIEKGIEATEKMLCSEDAIRMGGSPAPTFTCLAMAMEDKAHMTWAAARCYEQALKHLGGRRKDGGRRLPAAGTWERAVVLQQVGAVCLRNGAAKEAAEWLADCAEECQMATGHPRDVSLFQGAFSTQQTRSELKAGVEKMRAQAYHKLGDMPKAHSHLAEAQKLMSLASGDAVERVEAAAASATEKPDASKGGYAADGGATMTPAVGSKAPAPVASNLGAAGDIKELWGADIGEETALHKYRYTDEGSTVVLTIDLNDHLGLGDEASAMVDSLRQFKVTCEAEALTIRLRIRCPPTKKGHTVREFRMHLEPLTQEIVPEDTVPRLKGREGKRRLEVKLFKRDASRAWLGEFVKAGVKTLKAEDTASSKVGKSAVSSAPKGSQLNPLTPEELARLPRPSAGNCDNRPSAWRHDASPAQDPPKSAEPAVIAAPQEAPASLEEMD
eukprot:TRINITY_DN11398_c0_g1_i1.p1 TRINITY_DN11398_c0_g1~~TRINITY_DN11398_c0_g1_i1.p1  ORF type:complete len:508 (+),score=122.49 TRINITY_DN11398_c0_g1_i1:91-1524(+)